MATSFEPGSTVWVKTPETWAAATVTSSSGGNYAFKLRSGQDFKLDAKNVSRDTVMPMHPTSVTSVEDMATLADLHEGAILHNIDLRYAKDLIYTYIGSILCAVNPYKKIDMYGDKLLKSYNKRALGELPPHIYAIANEAYYALWKTNHHQCVLISGESGAGKTESTKLILKYLSTMSNAESLVEKQILESSPIMEAFGNAKTVYNNNSSRFGKFIKIQFSDRGAIEGAKIIDYLLEKGRVVRLNPGERNYHVFYNLLTGGSREEKASLLLTSADNYRYTKMGGVLSDPSIDDVGDYKSVRSAMITMGFTPEQSTDIFKVIAGILHLGNIEFVTSGGAQVKNRTDLANASAMFGVDDGQLGENLTSKTITLRGESITTPLDGAQAEESRDSLAMALYSRVFSWIITRINKTIHAKETFLSVGVLDIFGFENFQVNSFEQFCINYANEKLQQYFNRHIFSLEQLEYQKENISWADIDWVDNAECLDLIEAKLGLLALLDEESRFPKGTDETLLQKFHERHEKNKYYIKPRLAKTSYGIRHYAGDVQYETAGFLEKNRDNFRDDLVLLLQESKSDFVYDLFEKDAVADSSKENKAGARKKPTVSAQFKDSLSSLMTALGAAHPYFVRCVKPNMKKVPASFEAPVVLNQLRYSGMLETVRIRRAGYPVRRVFDDFLYRYRVLGRGVKAPNDIEKCKAVLRNYDPQGKDWQIGKTKVFLRESLEIVLEKKREDELAVVLRIIKSRVLGYAIRRRFLKIRRAIVLIQKNYKGFYGAKQFKQKRKAAVHIQKIYRGYRARLLRARLLEQKRKEEERRREEIRRKEEERRKEMERLQRENKTRELEELKRKADEEARLEAAEEERARQANEADAQKAKALEAELDAKRKIEDDKRKAEEEAKRRAQADVKRKAEAAKLAAELDLDDGGDEEAQGGIDKGAESDDEEAESEAIDEYKEGYMVKQGGRIKTWKRRWFILRDGTLAYFKGKQGESQKAGWLTKQGGAVKSWKLRWMVLKDGKLSYFKSDAEQEECLGTVDIRKDVSGIEEPAAAKSKCKKDNAFGLITTERTYYMFAESAEACEEWLAELKAIRSKTDDEMKSLDSAQVDFRNAQGQVDLVDILSVGSTNDPTRPNTFAIVTANRVFQMQAETPQEYAEWIRVLTPRKKHAGDSDQEILEKGWLVKEGGARKSRKKRWFTLRKDVIYYHKDPYTDVAIGTIPLNSLCSVVPPDELVGQNTGSWSFFVHARRRSYYLVAATQADATRWVSAIQEIIDSKAPIETQTEKLIAELKTAKVADVDRIYSSYPILTCGSEPLKSSLLPLPYGDLSLDKTGARTYTTLFEEAMKISQYMVHPEYIVNPLPLIQYILQTCFDLPKIRNEVYCQLIKQTTDNANPNSQISIRNWQILTVLGCSFLPARKYVRFLRFHLKRSLDRYPNTEVAKYAAYCMDCIQQTKYRDYPASQEEIVAIQTQKELLITVLCQGGRTCKVAINSFTTAGEVTELLKRKLNMERCINGFGLYELSGDVQKSIEEKTIVVDILGKWEKYKRAGYVPGADGWRLVFKLFCVHEVHTRNLSPIELEFVHAAACEQVMARRFPCDENQLFKLSALMMQYDMGDMDPGIQFDKQCTDFKKYYPMKVENTLANSPISLSALKNTMTGTLRKIKSNFDDSQSQEILGIKAQLATEWSKLRGKGNQMALSEFMAILQSWDGYGCTIFDVENPVKEKNIPKNLWLAVGIKGVALYKPGTRECVASYGYETILSFGAPVANTYKIVIDGQGTVTFETTKVLEIAKLMKAYINELVRRRRAGLF
ncbi:myosin-X [Capsaspora owczarzaki ATCC 30864]|uniref:Myosin-X n=1 Tax=Capsaspora owczarzaki (strain ATCC 30864) TaxID=595528 RepID=A0A0D2WLJ3_CAPO3|nr:myosin-X [Capsaspora owczarzaki ATCC 30864]KJE90748.1 myosin-X [Capsaspora owczarzaki ATCC 30864]|eukprot:XP_004348757.2 myosin-X [Capsaspora owczarzaki ATCC 30864]